jgi:hypothetical protein
MLAVVPACYGGIETRLAGRPRDDGAGGNTKYEVMWIEGALPPRL